MERFTLKIIDKPKSTLRNICRLCGMDNPNKISILRDEDVFCEDDVPLATKISVCCGIEVVKKDKMPQKICTLCSDKINDFFEFREMCSATQVQTRDLLGLPREVPKPKVAPQPPPPPAPLPTQNHDTPSQTILQPPIISESRMRDRRAPTQTRPSKKKKKAIAPVKAPPAIVKPEVEDSPPPPPPPPSNLKKQKVKKKAKPAAPKKVKFVQPVAEKRSIEEEPAEPKPRAKKARVEKVKTVKVKPVKPPPMTKCPVCGDVMEKDIYAVHMHQLHSPRTYQFGCSACAVPFDTREDLQDHQNWHKQANIPYRCFKCHGTFERISAYTHHTAKSCPGNIEFSNIVPNIDCTICRRQFVTFNLYNWHDCFIKSNTNCPKCNKFIQRKQNLFKHIFSCAGKGNFAPESQDQEEEDVEMPEIKREKVAVEKPPEKKVKPLKIRIFDKKRHSTASSATVTKVIKTEPDSTLEIEESQVNVEAPSLTTTIEDIQPPTEKSEKAKKKTLKNPYAAIIRKIKQEPKDTPDLSARMAKIVLQKLPEAVSSPRPTVRVKQEPVDTGYESMIHIAAKNIKKERIDPAEASSAQEEHPQPEEASQETTEEAPPPPELPRGVRIKQERPEKEVIVKPEPIDHAYDKHLPKPAGPPLQKVAKKRVFKIPSALIKKIQQERSTREQQDSQESQAEESQEIAQVAQNSVPVITGVRSIEKRDFSEPFSTIRIKSERVSPPRTAVHDENIPEENCVNANGENGNHEEEGLETSSSLENTAQETAESIGNNSEHPPVAAEESVPDPEDHESPLESTNHQNGEVNNVPTNNEESSSGQNDRNE